jgi:hypothetical protein
VVGSQSQVGLMELMISTHAQSQLIRQRCCPLRVRQQMMSLHPETEDLGHLRTSQHFLSPHLCLSNLTERKKSTQTEIGDRHSTSSAAVKSHHRSITGPSSSSSRKERLLRAQICENAIFDQPILRLGVGDFNVHEMGRDEDDDGVPAATLMQSQPATTLAAV